MKSERLKKLESELRDLEKWLNLDLVPNKDVEKHKIEIETVRTRIEDEKQRLIFLKESGDIEDYTSPKKSNQKQIYDHQSMPDTSAAQNNNMTNAGFDMETTSFEADHTTLFDIEMAGEDKETKEQDSEEDPYSDKNRWKRSTEIVDPESDDW